MPSYTSRSAPTTQPASLSTSTATLVEASERTPLFRNDQDVSGTIPSVSIASTISSSNCDGEEVVEGEEVVAFPPGKSSFWQTLLNVLGDLVGTGLLASPIAIAHCGWILGPLLLGIITAITLWTLKIIIRIIEKDRSLRNFADVARYGLGPQAERWITVMFICDCCIWLIAVIVLFSDSFQVVLPMLTSDQWKVMGLVGIVPLNFLPLRFLSWTSGVGVTCTWILVASLVVTGLITPTFPGSVWDPAPTNLWPAHGWIKFGLSFGLLISGFGGHFLVPNLIRDMKHPEQAEKVCEVSYGICVVVYSLVSVFGYLMFGTDVSDEVSRDLGRLSSFSPLLSKIAPWAVAIIPLTKLPLGLRPLTDIVYSKFNLQPTIFVPKTHFSYTEPSSPPSLPPTPKSTSSVVTLQDEHYIHALSNAESAHQRREKLKALLRALITVLLLTSFVGGALIFPSFESLMSIMGGGMSVITCILIPIAAGAGVWGWRWYTRLIFVVSLSTCVIGVLCAILNDSTTS